jgi:hypothetical protein
LPVLSSEPPSALTPGQTYICHYGSGSAQNGQAEHCGTVLSDAQRKQLCKAFQCDAGVVFAAMEGHDGDSGGPVYEYNEARTGVVAVGIEIIAQPWCVKVQCTPISGFYPIDSALNRLHLTLNT